MEYNHTQSLFPKKKLIIFTILIVLLVLVAYWSSRMKKQELTPEQQLEQLQATSQPVTATEAERQAQLERMEKESFPIPASINREKILQDLEQ